MRRLLSEIFLLFGLLSPLHASLVLGPRPDPAPAVAKNVAAADADEQHDAELDTDLGRRAQEEEDEEEGIHSEYVVNIMSARQDGTLSSGETCESDIDCSNLACAYRRAYDDSRKYCCPSGDYVYSSVLGGNVCTDQPPGAPCTNTCLDWDPRVAGAPCQEEGAMDAMCASGVCVAGVCFEDQVDPGGNCDTHSDCAVGFGCALPSASPEALGGKVCCPSGSYVEFSDGPLDEVCTDQPEGAYCRDVDELCESGDCDWFCGGFPSYENDVPTEPTRFLTVAEFIQIQATESNKEFAMDEEGLEELMAFLASMNMTLEELWQRAEEVWDDASRFELHRAIRAEQMWGATYPYVVCHVNGNDGGGGGEESSSSGNQRKQKLLAAIREAMSIRQAMDGIDREEESDDLVLRPLFNDRNMMCGLAMLHGSVAKSVSCVGCVVQPVLQAMKMMPETTAMAEALMSAAIGDYYDEGDEGVMEDNSSKEKTLEDFPSLDVVTCAGTLSKEKFEYLQSLDEDGDGTVDTSDLNDYLLSSILGWGIDVSYPEIARNIYWANPNAKSVFPYDDERGASWWDVVNYTVAGNECEPFFRDRLIWIGRLGESEDDYFYQRVYWNDTQVRKEDQYCVLGLLVLVAVDRTVCQMEITADKETDDQTAAWLVQSGIEGQKPWYDLGLDGSGQRVAVSDTGIDVDNCYFYDALNGPPTEIADDSLRKVIQYIPSADDVDEEWGHGTHVAGTVAGKRATDGIDESAGAADGVAPGAKIAFIDIGEAGKPLNVPNDRTLLGTGRPEAKIHSVSWGGTNINYYNSQAKSFDDYLYEHPDLLVVAAAGNTGRNDKANTVGAPAIAKNVLTVGASHSFGDDLLGGQLGPAYIADFSSRGTADGRMKPEVVAPGKFILSAGARPSIVGECDGADIPPAGGKSDGLLSKAGTSQATPVTSGTAALVRQYFEEGWYATGEMNSGIPVSPSAAMLKAVLMNGAQADMKGVDNGSNGVTPVAPYDNTQGFGRIDLSKSVYIAGKTDVQITFWDNEVINDGEAEQYSLTIDKSNGCTFDKLSVTLAWMEPGSAMGCIRCVLNDLDLHVTKSGNERRRYYPNGLPRADDINIVERVVVNASDGDMFTLHVTASNLFDATQTYALVATGCFGGVPSKLDTTANVFATDDSALRREENTNENATMTTTIIIITCSVVGGLILLLLLGWLVKSRRRKTGTKNGSGPEQAV